MSRNRDNQAGNGFSARFIARAAEIGLSDAEIGRRSGISTSTLSRYRNGGSPNSEHVFPLADALGCSARWLIAGVDDRVALASAEDADWVEMSEFDLRDVTETGKGPAIARTIFRRDWLYRALGESSGLWIARTLSPHPALSLPLGAPIVCKDHPQGELPVEGQHYVFRVNGGIVLSRFSYRGAVAAAAGEPVVSPTELDQESGQYFIVARVLGSLARPLV